MLSEKDWRKRNESALAIKSRSSSKEGQGALCLVGLERDPVL